MKDGKGYASKKQTLHSVQFHLILWNLKLKIAAGANFENFRVHTAKNQMADNSSNTATQIKIS